MGAIDAILAGLDRLYFALRRGSSRPGLFRRGWGDSAAIDAVIARFRARGPALAIAPAWDAPWNERGRYRFRDGSFASPLFRELLPAEAALARFRMYLPEEDTRRMVVAVPTRFEEGYAKREALAADLAALGIGSLLLECPFMGRRRPAYQPTPMLASLSDFVLMGGAAIEEARSALQWLRLRGFPEVCVTGVSLGGFLAAIAGALAAPPVAIVTFLAPHDGNVVYLDGLSRKLCDWREMQASCGSPAPVAEKFRAVFDAISLEQMPEPKSRVIAVAAAHDLVVPPDSYRRMAALWPSTELRWIRGGHVSGMLRRKVYLGAILDALPA